MISRRLEDYISFDARGEVDWLRTECNVRFFTDAEFSGKRTFTENMKRIREYISEHGVELLFMLEEEEFNEPENVRYVRIKREESLIERYERKEH